MPEYEIIEEREKEIQKEERKTKIENSKYNKWYKVIRGEGIPAYLKKGWTEKRWSRITRFRLGNEIKESRYWEKEENRKCRICEEEEETWEHVWEGCREGERETRESWQEVAERMLGEEGKGEEWMKEVMEKRGKKVERENVE